VRPYIRSNNTRSSANAKRTARPLQKYREPQIFGSFPSPRLRRLFLWVWFLVGLGKAKLCTKFEVASFNHCVYIEGNPQILGSTHSLDPCLPFLLRVILSWDLTNSSCMPNLKSLAPFVAEILQGNPKILAMPTRTEKCGWPWARRAPQNFGVPL